MLRCLILRGRGGGQASFRIISSPGRSPGRAIVLPPASALALALASALASAASVASALANVKVFTLKFLCDGQGAVRRAILSL